MSGINSLVDYLNKHTGLELCGFTHDGLAVMSDGIIRVRIGSDQVLAEHEANFDKWHKSFYSCDFPKSDLERRLLVSDLAYIQCKDDVESGDKYGRLRRSF